jgi:hypothetical protein
VSSNEKELLFPFCAHFWTFSAKKQDVFCLRFPVTSAAKTSCVLQKMYENARKTELKVPFSLLNTQSQVSNVGGSYHFFRGYSIQMTE